MKYGLTFIIFVFLFGCRQQTSQIKDVDKEKIPFHKVIYLDKYYSDYLNAIKSDFSNRDKIYSEKIKDVLIKDHFSNSAYSDFVLESFSYPIADTSDLAKFISDLNANRVQVETIITSVFASCNKQLKNDSVTFYLVPSTSDIKDIINKMGGVTGQTAGNKQILITIDFNVNSWNKVLEYVIAHEYNHAYWTNVNLTDTYKWTLLRYLVFEGKADSFAHLLYPNVKAPWTSSLSDKEKADLWNKIKPDLQSVNGPLLGEVMFGSKNYPIWGGYNLGYDIVQKAFKNHPDILKTNWTDLDADKLLELSNYN
ncbi:MAG: DUF2268 domain-containing putative Zn-dependent protease [Bacteroidia bacterium]